MAKIRTGTHRSSGKSEFRQENGGDRQASAEGRMKRSPVSIRKQGFERAADMLNGRNPLISIAAAKKTARRAERISLAISNSDDAQVQAKEPGHDGNPPKLRPPRDRGEWEKKKDTIPDFNENTDRLEWLMEHGHIDQFQRAAGEILQKDWYLSEIINYASLSGGGGGSPKSTLADGKLMAGRRYGLAMAAALLWPCRADGKPLAFRARTILTKMILEDNWSAEQMAKHWHIRESRVMPILRDALSALVDHYKCGGKKKKRGTRDRRPLHPFHPFQGSKDNP
jgi:hypothetical protein